MINIVFIKVGVVCEWLCELEQLEANEGCLIWEACLESDRFTSNLH